MRLSGSPGSGTQLLSVRFVPLKCWFVICVGVTKCQFIVCMGVTKDQTIHNPPSTSAED